MNQAFSLLVTPSVMVPIPERLNDSLTTQWLFQPPVAATLWFQSRQYYRSTDKHYSGSVVLECSVATFTPRNIEKRLYFHCRRVFQQLLPNLNVGLIN